MPMVDWLRMRAGWSSKGIAPLADGEGLAGEACLEAERGDFEWVLEGPGVLGVIPARGVDGSGVGISIMV